MKGLPPVLTSRRPSYKGSKPVFPFRLILCNETDLEYFEPLRIKAGAPLWSRATVAVVVEFPPRPTREKHSCRGACGLCAKRTCFASSAA